MFKRILSFIGLMALMVLMTGVLTAATLLPVTTFTLVEGLPDVMIVGDVHTVIVHVESDQEFLFAQTLPSFQFVGKGVVAVQGGDHFGRGTSSTLQLTFKAKSSTTEFPGGGVAPVFVVVGVRYGGGYIAVQQYEFKVKVP